MFKWLFDVSRKELKRISVIAEKVIALESTYKELTDDELKSKTNEFKKRLEYETLDDILVESFATVREASTRVLGMTPFPVQIKGAIAIHEGNIAEMKTGEGKTLTSVMPAYLNALTGKGVHIVTVNDYLARREAEGEIGELFKWLGLTVGLNLRELSKEEKKAAYECDILYSTNNELGFDYLRDHMVVYKNHIVQRPLNYAIIDEVDSILIDEARTPLIISGKPKNIANQYQQANLFAKKLSDADYEIDIKTRVVNLSESGIAKAEQYFSLENLYDLDAVGIVHNINNALKAHFIFEKDVDYVVQENKVIIVDSHTGRLMHGRQYSEGLHQALEAKENVEIKDETQTLASITFQNFFRMYNKLSGMTGTAKTEEEEFTNIYNMYVIEIPTNKPVIREDRNDLIFATMKAKYTAIANEIKIRHEKGQPILVGTISIETSELLSQLLKRRGVKHDVLNAKQHEREAEIVEKAGQKGSVTIATNMAGRGTDIKLGEGVVELGGLAVIGTERHESRRIDNQLRGRSGRQGDPGFSQFFLSAEDDLMKRFGGDSFKNRIAAMTTDKSSDSEAPLNFKIFSSMVERAQTQIEGNNFDRRKTVLQYDEVLRQQREVIYKQRMDVLFSDNVIDFLKPMVSNTLENILSKHWDEANENNKMDVYNAFNNVYFSAATLNKEDIKSTYAETLNHLNELSFVLINKKFENVSEQQKNNALTGILLRIVDTYWIEHIDRMYELRQGIGLQSYAQKNPLREYKEAGFTMFNDMIQSLQESVTRTILRARVHFDQQREQVAKPLATHSGKEEAKKPKTIHVVKIGRNDPCPCGSGKKYKQCCGRGK
jgi:preprotein translocase subunit SecA